MDKILRVLILLIEYVIVFQCVQISFCKLIKLDSYVMGMAFLDVMIYTLVNLGIIPMACTIVIYVVLFVFCYYRFKMNIMQTLIRFIVTFSLLGGIEGTASFMTNVFRKADNTLFILFLSSAIAMVLSFLIKWLVPPLLKSMSTIGNLWIEGIMLFYGLVISVLIIDYRISNSAINMYFVIALIFLLVFFFYLHRLGQSQNEIERKNYEIELQRIYGGTYQDLLEEVRKRQHAYKNHMAALLGMHLTAQTLDELISMQRKYGDELKTDCKFDSVLTCCNNQVLAGFIYHRCIACENENVIVDYNIHIDQAKCRFALHEIIEILGILMDNAFENVKMYNFLEQCMRMEFTEDEGKIILSVSNPAEYIPFEEIDRMLCSGYSSKGKGRGIGLARVLELVKKYEAEIKVYNTDPYNNNNWICFLIVIGK